MCSCLGHKTFQGSPVETGCSSGNKTHTAATNFVQVSATAIQYFVRALFDLLC